MQHDSFQVAPARASSALITCAARSGFRKRCAAARPTRKFCAFACDGPFAVGRAQLAPWLQSLGQPLGCHKPRRELQRTITMPNPSTTPNQERLQRQLEDLQTLKDQIRVDLHLAKMDLQDEWKNIERRLPDRATFAAELKTTTAEIADALAEELRRFRDRLRKNIDRQA
jgi:hypothetical protein